jgi:DEAD/DEAH box helicase domain-containing protein
VIKRLSPDDFLDEDDPAFAAAVDDDLLDFPRSPDAPPAAPIRPHPTRQPDCDCGTHHDQENPSATLIPPAAECGTGGTTEAGVGTIDPSAAGCGTGGTTEAGVGRSSANSKAHDVPGFIDYLEHGLLEDTIVHRRTVAARPEKRVIDPSHLGPRVSRIMAAAGIDRLWSHQEEGIAHLQEGRNVVVATPTSSGKTMVYNAAVLDDLMQHPAGCAIYIFPLKALEQDQLGELRSVLGGLSCGLTAEIYDGDTKPHLREKIRKNPPNILITTPDMLHSGLLAFHEAWEEVLKNLRWIVVDELHTYNGIFGSHVLHLFRRLNRLCSCYDTEPRFVTCSATIGNPQQLAERLFGRSFVAITDSGAPSAKKHFLFVDPVDSPNTVASRLLQAGVLRQLRTIVFTRARTITELVYRWATQHRTDLRRKISSYRAGYLPEERRQIESQLINGDLLGVVTTSALELGIDIGGLDVCVLVGYPGSIVNTWQRAGRVGRRGRESLVILLASRDALDQYFMKNPEQFFGRDIEDAVADPSNHYILEQHLPCAARELPLTLDEPEYAEIPGYRQALDTLTARGELLQSADGDAWFASRKQPHRLVNMRAIGESWTIVAGGRRRTATDQVDTVTEQSEPVAVAAQAQEQSPPADLFATPDSVASADDTHGAAATQKRQRHHSAPAPTRGKGYTIGTVSGGQLYSECYAGAVYLHRGKQYLIGERNPVKRQIEAQLVDVPYYTRPKKEKETEILEELASKPMHGYQAKLGRLRVESQVVAFEKVRVGDGVVISKHPLDSPVEVFETVGFWLEMDAPFKKHLKRRSHHHMGSLHATEHATKSLFPLLALSKGTDVGGICYPMHPQLRKSAIFIYDQYPGGIGLAEKGFDMLERLLELTLGMVQGCDCEEGCPSCIHFATCGAGNHPLDKPGCIHLLELLSGRAQLDAEALNVTDLDDEPPLFADWETVAEDVPVVPEELEQHVVVFDLETQLSAAEVGGWGKTYLMRVSCGIVWDSRTDEFTTYLEDRVQDLIEHLKSADLVVGFNCIGFDYSVLRGYTRYDFRNLETLDMLREIKEQLNFRVSLNSLAHSTLDKEKSADGLQALRWWKQGRLDLIEQYCRDDVAITRDIWRYGRDRGYLLFDRKNEGRMRIPVDFSEKVLALD